MLVKRRSPSFVWVRTSPGISSMRSIIPRPLGGLTSVILPKGQAASTVMGRYGPPKLQADDCHSALFVAIDASADKPLH